MNRPAATMCRRPEAGRGGHRAGGGALMSMAGATGRMRVLAGVALLACWPTMVRADDLGPAMALANEGRFQEAHQWIAPLLAAEPDHFRARLLQGVLRAREGRLDDAARLFEALRDAYPERPEPHNNLAAVYVAQDRLAEAQAALLAAIARKPELPAAHENLADLYIRLARSSSLRARDLAGAAGSDRNAPADAPPPGTTVTAGEPDPNAATRVGPAAPDARVCVRTSGLADAVDARTAAAWLESQGASVEVRRDHAEVVRDHWVFHRPLPSPAEAVAKMEAMQAAGVEDIAVIRHGDLTNGISLGVYRSTDNMRRRIAALEQMGYPVQYETTLETVITYWLDARLPVFPAFLQADWAAEFPDRALEVVPCSAP